MGFTKKIWKNRIAEYINRRRLTMEDGSTSLVTVARDEGTISQEGDAFNAANMNNLEDRIAAGFEEINRSLTGLQQIVNWLQQSVNELNKSTLGSYINIRESQFICHCDGIFVIYCVGQVKNNYVYGYVNGAQLLGASSLASDLESHDYILMGNPAASLNVKRGWVLTAKSASWANNNAYFIPFV